MDKAPEIYEDEEYTNIKAQSDAILAMLKAMQPNQPNYICGFLGFINF